MRGNATDCALARDILEWNVPDEVLAVLLKDRSTGRNLIWATDDYAARGKGFGANEAMVKAYWNVDKMDAMSLYTQILPHFIAEMKSAK